jgi:molybdate transport system regulatory protein
MKEQYKLNGRIWIESGNKAFLGIGKAELLMKTAQLGSLRKASKEMGISYRQAWYSLNQLNNLAGNPLILFQRGGKSGGTATLTDSGKEMLELFEKSQSEFNIFLKRLNEMLGK